MSEPRELMPPLPEDPLVSVVIPNWNGAHHLPPCLDALRAQTHPRLEVIVADNASTDGSLELLAERYPEVRVIALPENRGFGAGHNFLAARVPARPYDPLRAGHLCAAHRRCCGDAHPALRGGGAGVPAEACAAAVAVVRAACRAVFAWRKVIVCRWIW